MKESAIACMSLVISTFGDSLQRELPACLPILVDRMGNEITRLTAVKVIVLCYHLLFYILIIYIFHCTCAKSQTITDALENKMYCGFPSKHRNVSYEL